jgi:sigma-B regulation protein RsbQ
MDVIARNQVAVRGSGGPVLMFAHGFGCDQSMWQRVARNFEADHRIVLFDHVGAGASDISAYTEAKYGSLQGYADDAIEICAALGLGPVIFVGHSVSATIGVLAAVKRPDLFAGLILVCPSPRYTNTDCYTGGFEERDIEELLTLMDINQLDWSATMAPVVMGAGAEAAIQTDWRESVCRTDPGIAKAFARVTFTSDHRGEYRQVTTPTLIVACSDDMLAPQTVSCFVHEAIAESRLVTLDATGHCPHMTHPDETIAAIRDYLAARGAMPSAA